MVGALTYIGQSPDQYRNESEPLLVGTVTNSARMTNLYRCLHSRYAL